MTSRHRPVSLFAVALLLLWPGLGRFVAPHAGVHDLLHLALFAVGFLLAGALPPRSKATEAGGGDGAPG